MQTPWFSVFTEVVEEPWLYFRSHIFHMVSVHFQAAGMEFFI